LFDKAVVVFAVGAAPGEGQVLTLAVEEEFLVNELTAVVRVEPEDREGEACTHVLQAVQHPAACFAAQGDEFSSARSDIGQGEAVNHVGSGRTALLSH
jgi:hypothetical protein